MRRGVAGRPRRRSASSCSPTTRVASKTVTAAKLPEGHDWKAFNGAIKAHGVVLAGGQGKLTGKIFRLGHLGSVTVDEILGAIAVLERVALEQGRRIEPGRGGRGGPGGGARGPDAARRRRQPARPRPRRRPRVRVLVAEPIAARGHRPRSAPSTRSTSGRASPATSSARSCADYDALVVRSQVQVDAAVIAAAGNAPPGHRPGRRRRRQRRPRRGDARPGSRSSTPRPATRSRPPSTRSRCCTASPARIAAADASVRRGEWKRAQFTGLELRGRTLGIVGLGKIGQAIAARARAMEMAVLASDPFVTAEQAALHGVELVPFDDAARPGRRRHRPRAADAGDARADRARPDRPDEARGDPPERRPRRDHRRGGGRRRRCASGQLARRRRSTSSRPSRRRARRSSTRRTRS